MRSPLAVAAAVSLALLARPALPHCDTLDGPVIRDARAALETRDVTPAAAVRSSPWVNTRYGTPHKPAKPSSGPVAPRPAIAISQV